MQNPVCQQAAAMREFALGLPGAYEEFPWGESVIKVNKKIFLFLGKSDESAEVLGMSVKLPDSGVEALELTHAQPTGYGLGKAGWVSMHFPADEVPPLEFLERWILESYRAIAPKKLSAQFDPPGTPRPKS